MEQEEIEEERIEAPLNDQNQLEVRKYFESNSTWTNIKKGPLGVALYMFATYSRVIFDRIILRSKLNETWTAWQETSVRTVKWSLDAPLDRVRKNSRFVGQVLQNSCPEPVEKLVGVPKVKGCWIGRKTWKGRKTEAVVMYIHGGAYVANSPIGFPPLCYLLRTLRRRYKKNVSIFAVDYPLSPESQYPEPIDAAERAYRWLVKKSGVDGRNNIILCGDSAGGGIVLGLLQRLYQQNNTSSGSFTIPNIYLSGVVLVSPWVELSCESVTHFTNAKYDFIPQHFWPLAAEYYLFGSQLNQQNQEKEWKRNPREEKSIDAKTKVSQWLQDIETSPLLNVVENEESNPMILDDLDNDTSAVASSPYRKQDDKQKRKIKATVYQDPAVSPMHTSHELLALYPPMLITYGGKEMFKDDIEFFIRRCLEAKCTLTDNISETMMSTSNYSNEQLHLMYGQHPDIEVEMDREMVHNYPWLPQIFDKHARDGLDRIAEFIATRITKPIQSQTSSSPASLLKGQSRPSTLSNTTLRTKSQWSGLPQEHVAHGTARADKVLSLLINDLAETPNSRRILPIH